MWNSHKSKIIYKDLRTITYNIFIVELWYYHRTVIVEIKYKKRAFFKTLSLKKATTWRLKKYSKNNKLL